MKIDIERYNKSTMPENAEKYFYGPTGIRRTRCDSQSLKLVFEIKSDRLVAVGVVVRPLSFILVYLLILFIYFLFIIIFFFFFFF